MDKMFRLFGLGNGGQKVYMDYASTTPVLKSVIKSMEPYLADEFFNASSIYDAGVQIKRAVESSRKSIAYALGANSKNIIFTGSGTEANNLAILGSAMGSGDYSNLHFVTSKIEHPSILETFKELERRGAKVDFLPVEESGLVDLKELKKVISQNTKLVSINFVNSEIGVIQPIKEISKIIRKAEKTFGTEILFHTDACQAFNYIKIDCIKLGVDLLTLDASKVYGPKGIGLLYVSNRVALKPIIFGGGQEGGLRSGTEATQLVVGFANAIEIGEKDREKETQRITKLRNKLIEEIQSNFKDAELNGSLENRIANNINFCFKGVDSEYAVIKLDKLGIMCAFASSCKSLGDDSSSYVIDALGKGDCKTSSLRFTLGRGSKESDIKKLIKALRKVALGV